MFDELLKDVERLLQDKALLTIDDVSQLLDCDRRVVYNWTKRQDPSRRPPKFPVGKSFRFPKTQFLRWLMNEWSSSEGSS